MTNSRHSYLIEHQRTDNLNFATNKPRKHCVICIVLVLNTQLGLKEQSKKYIVPSQTNLYHFPPFYIFIYTAFNIMV